MQEALDLQTCLSEPTINGDARTGFVLLARRRTSAGFAEIGRFMGITGAGASYLLKNAEARLRRDPAFATFVADAEERLDGKEDAPF